MTGIEGSIIYGVLRGPVKVTMVIPIGNKEYPDCCPGPSIASRHLSTDTGEMLQTSVSGNEIAFGPESRASDGAYQTFSSVE